MPTQDREIPARPLGLAEEAVALVRRWLSESAPAQPDTPPARLAALLRDPAGLAFATGLADGVVAAEAGHVAGKNLERLARNMPGVLPWYMRWAVLVGGGFAAAAPWPIVPIARRVMRRMTAHLLVEAGGTSDPALGLALARLRSTGTRLDLTPLGESAPGDAEADRQLAQVRELLARGDVDAVTISLAGVAGRRSLWAFDDSVRRIVARLTPLYEFAAASLARKLITLDSESAGELDLNIAVFRSLLERPALQRLEAGITVPAYLPGALSAVQALTEWAAGRRAAGGAAIRVRLVKGAYLPQERLTSRLQGWPLAPYGRKLDTDANYKRVVAWSLTPERTDAVRLAVAGHNLFDVADAWLLAKSRGVERRIEFEMHLGMGTAQAAVAAKVGGLVLGVPVVLGEERGSAAAYLVRRLEERSDGENFLAGLGGSPADPAGFARESARFLASVEAMHAGVPADPPEPARPAVTTGPFRNTPTTDPASAVNREWASAILERAGHSTLGAAEVAQSAAGDQVLRDRIAATARAGEAWGRSGTGKRAEVLRASASELEAARGRLIEVTVSETEADVAAADVEVSAAIDSARYYALRAPELDRLDHARYRPQPVTLVVTAGASPLAAAADLVLAALASGSGVIVHSAHARRSTAVLVDALWRAGVPRDCLQLAGIGPDDSEPAAALPRSLVTDPSLSQVLLCGSWDQVRRIRAWRPELPLLARTGGGNAVIVSAAADLDGAVRDVVTSAFRTAGQRAGSIHLAILVGALADSTRFRRQLADAIATLPIGVSRDLPDGVGPLVEPAAGDALAALTELGEGEEWLIEPHRLDEAGRLWSPGLRDGVRPGSRFHLGSGGAPVLGLMRAGDLSEAIDLQNALPAGLAAGIHSLDPDEVRRWLETVQAGNLYVNRDTLGTAAQRQPFGGWRRSTYGPATKAGGPNSLFMLGRFEAVFPEPRESVVLRGVSDRIARLIEAAQPGMDYLGFDRVRAAARSDQVAWESEFRASRDLAGLELERNVFRYRPVPVAIRLAEGTPPWQLVRVIAAALRAGSPLAISSAAPISASLVRFLREDVPDGKVTGIVVETDARWYARLLEGEAGADRIRLLGGDPAAALAALGSESMTALYAKPVTAAGRIELLAFLREQSVSIAAHRFGRPDAAMASLIV